MFCDEGVLDLCQNAPIGFERLHVARKQARALLVLGSLEVLQLRFEPRDLGLVDGEGLEGGRSGWVFEADSKVGQAGLRVHPKFLQFIKKLHGR